MNRKETTKFLTDILVTDRLSDRKYFAKEVSVDYGTDHTKRVDVMQFVPEGVIHASSIEKGIFICYEIKSCSADIYSGNGLNFLGEKNYIVTTILSTKTSCRTSPVDISCNMSRNISQNRPRSSDSWFLCRLASIVGVLIPFPMR